MKAGIGETCYAVSALRKVCFHKDLQSARVCTRDGHAPIKVKTSLKLKLLTNHTGRVTYVEHIFLQLYVVNVLQHNTTLYLFYVTVQRNL